MTPRPSPARVLLMYLTPSAAGLGRYTLIHSAALAVGLTAFMLVYVWLRLLAGRELAPLVLVDVAGGHCHRRDTRLRQELDRERDRAPAHDGADHGYLGSPEGSRQS